MPHGHYPIGISLLQRSKYKWWSIEKWWLWWRTRRMWIDMCPWAIHYPCQIFRHASINHPALTLRQSYPVYWTSCILIRSPIVKDHDVNDALGKILMGKVQSPWVTVGGKIDSGWKLNTQWIYEYTEKKSIFYTTIYHSKYIRVKPYREARNERDILRLVSLMASTH